MLKYTDVQQRPAQSCVCKQHIVTPSRVNLRLHVQYNAAVLVLSARLLARCRDDTPNRPLALTAVLNLDPSTVGVQVKIRTEARLVR